MNEISGERFDKKVERLIRGFQDNEASLKVEKISRYSQVKFGNMDMPNPGFDPTLLYERGLSLPFLHDTLLREILDDEIVFNKDGRTKKLTPFDFHYLYMRITMLPDVSAEYRTREFRLIWSLLRDVVEVENGDYNFPSVGDISRVENFSLEDWSSLKRYEMIWIILTVTIEMSNFNMELILSDLGTTLDFVDYRLQQYLARMMCFVRQHKKSILKFFHVATLY